jgi:sugar (pentulose or hexulose) kinase
MSLFLGIDFGTSGVRTSVINSNQEEIINFSVSIEKPTVKDSLVCQDPSLWWNSLIKNLQFLSTKIDLSKIERLSIDGTSGTVLICDGTGRPLDYALMYNDASSVEEAKLIEKISSGHPIVSSPTNALVRTLSLIKKNSAQSYKILHQADWIASKIIEEFKFSDENNALKLGYDCQERAWPNWFNELPLDEDSLPEILIPGQVMGNLKNQELLNLGFNSKLEVVAGTTDSIAAFLATGASQIGEAVTSIGTTLVVKAISAKPIFNREFGIYSHRLGDRWLAGGASNVGGKIIEELFGNKIEDLSKSLNPDKLLNLNYYPLAQTGERFPINDPNKKPILEPRPDKETDFFQAVLEGITQVEKLSYEKIVEIGGSYPLKIFTIGGGGKNQNWNTMRKKILKVELGKPLSNDASYGVALLASGIVSSNV